MGDSRSSEERLPWLATPPAKAVAAPPAARRARTPLLLLLALFLGGSIAVVAFLAGRSTAPDTARDAAPARSSVPVTARLPAAVPAAPVVPVVTAAPPQASPAAAKRASSPRRAAAGNRRPAARRATRSNRRNMIPRITRAFPTSPVATATPRRRANRIARPSAPPRGSVVQLGAYGTMPQADAAWHRLVGAYPYLSTLPRSVTVTAPSPGRPLYHRLRVAAGSQAQARALCDHLHRIGRGCMVVASAK